MMTNKVATTIDPAVAFYCGLTHALCSMPCSLGQSQTRDAALWARSRLVGGNPFPWGNDASLQKPATPSSKQSWLAENTRQQTAAPLPADLFTAVKYHHAFAPHTVRIPAGAAASAPARAGTACQAREHTGTRDGHGE